MNITRFGRVEADIMAIPQAAAGADGRSFADTLEQATAAAPERDPGSEPDAPQTEPDADEPAPPTTPDHSTAPRADEPSERAEAAPVQARVHVAPTEDQQHERAPQTRGGEPERRITPGKGTGSPRTLFFRGSNEIATSERLAQKDQAAVAVAGFVGQPQPNGATAVRASDNAPRVQGIDAASTAARATAARPTTAGYRTLTRQGVELVEQARESVFKQILLKLDGNGGGEMRMRLDPPEFGELDLHMVVDRSGTLRLSIAAERPELAQLLQKGLGELTAALQQQGIDIGHADVSTRSHGGGHDAAFAARRDSDDHDGDDETAPAARRQIITAQALDFWV